MKILLFGKSGQVGWELQRSLAPIGELITLDRAGSSLFTGDLSDAPGIVRTVRHFQPDVIINAAAYTAVDKAESEPELAHAINAIAPGALAREAFASGALLVHFSTDYVFDGTGSNPWSEHDPTGPLSEYGRTKLEGEELIRGSGCRHLVLRTSWVHAARGQNFAKTILRLATERDELAVINDQHGAPTGAELLSDAAAHAVRSVMLRPELSGTYHVVASGEATWFEYARHIIEAARAAGQPIRIAREAVRPVASEAYKTAARRPLNSRLDTSKFKATFGLELPHWTWGVDRMLSELVGR